VQYPHDFAVLIIDLSVPRTLNISGYLGKNPEHESVMASDRKYAVLLLATQRSWKGADEEWHS
jgi:hypothetical protein